MDAVVKGGVSGLKDVSRVPIWLPVHVGGLQGSLCWVCSVSRLRARLGGLSKLFCMINTPRCNDLLCEGFEK